MFLCILFMFLAASSRDILAQNPNPKIRWVVQTPEIARRDSAKYSYFRGVFIRERSSNEIFALLPIIFFDSSSSTLPPRYVLFTNSSDAFAFREDTVSSTMSAYYNALNIIGRRLSEDRFATITLRGGACEEPGLPKTLALARATTIRNYLRSIWEIDPKQVHLEGTALKTVSQLHHDMQEENRRVVIECNTWDIMRPIVATLRVRRPDPTIARLEAETGLPISAVAKSVIRVTYQGKLWKEIPVPTTDLINTIEYNWRSGDANKLPYGDGTMEAQLVVTDTGGHTYSSNVDKIDAHRSFDLEVVEEHINDTRRETYNLLRFERGTSQIDFTNELILRSYVLDRIQPLSSVALNGYANDFANAKQNSALSMMRARTVKKKLASLLHLPAEMSTLGMGEEMPLYDPSFPEGRYLNRTVQIVVETPWEYGWGN